MAFATIAAANGQGNGTTATTSALNSTGAGLAVAVITHRGTVAVSDSKSNSPWTLAKSSTDGTNLVDIYYCILTSVGSGHTFTAGSSTAPSIDVQVYSLASAAVQVDQTNSATGSASTIATGSVTPGSTNQLIVAGAFVGGSGHSVSSVDSGFAIAAQGTGDANNFGSALASIIETSVVAKNPTFTMSTTDTVLAAIATFKELLSNGRMFQVF